jgi:hypothetical protein
MLGDTQDVGVRISADGGTAQMTGVWAATEQGTEQGGAWWGGWEKRRTGKAPGVFPG